MTKKKKSKFRGKVSEDAQKQQNRGTAYGYLNLPKGITVFKEEGGKKILMDILPYVVTEEKHPDRDENLKMAMVGDEWYKRPFKIHRNIGVENETVLCRTSIGERCPVCEEMAKMKKDGAEKDDWYPLRPSLRNLYLIIPIGVKDFEEEIHVWDISQYNFQEMLNEELGENPEKDIFPDLEEGYSLRIRFSTEKIDKTKYASTSRIDFEKREKQYKEAYLKKVPSLDEFLKVLSYKELQNLFFELDDTDTSDEDTSKSDKKKNSSKKDKKRKRKTL